jgi:hypothetical protein
MAAITQRSLPVGGEPAARTFPLHYGAVPKWLASRMSRLGAVLAEAGAMNSCAA